MRHSIPQKISTVSTREWHLSEEGKEQAEKLAQMLTSHQPAFIATSSEPKAIETAEIISKKLEMAVQIVEGLHEHDRSNVGYLETSEFNRKVADFFNRPDELVFGTETANAAYQRFRRAVMGMVEKTPIGNVLIVSHGTVITLFMAQQIGIEPLGFWQKLSLPDHIVLPLAGLK